MTTSVRSSASGQYPTEADAVADLTLKVGDQVKTSEGSPSEYVVVAGGTGPTGDGYVNMANGLQLRVVSTGITVDPERNSLGGFEAGISITSGTNNDLIGNRAGTNITTGSYNSLLGSSAGSEIVTASHNCGFGHNALKRITTGEFNAGFGYQIMKRITTGEQNVGFGVDALGALTTGSGNSCFGNTTFQQITTSFNNTGVGKNAAARKMFGDEDVVMGFKAGFDLGTSNDNVILGAEAGSGFYDIPISPAEGASYMGRDAVELSAGVWVWPGESNQTGNVTVGRRADYKNSGGSFNVTLGQGAGLENTTGNNNVKVGYQAGRDISTGGLNTIVGFDAGSGMDASATNNIIIGGKAGETLSGSGQFLVALDSFEYLHGYQSASILRTDCTFTPLNASTKAVSLGENNNAHKWEDLFIVNSPTVGSDRKLKDISGECDLGLDFVKTLKPVKGKFKDGGKRDHYWLIAQDVEQSIKDAGLDPSETALWVNTPQTEDVVGESGDVEQVETGEHLQALRYQELIPVLIKSVKELSEEVDNLKAQLNQKS